MSRLLINKNIMEYLLGWAVVLFIFVYFELKRIREDNLEVTKDYLEENEKNINLINSKKEQSKIIKESAELLNAVRLDKQFALDKIKELKKSNSSNQGWNVKYRKTIVDLNSQIEDGLEDRKFWLDKAGEWEVKNQDQVDTIKKLNKYGVECQKQYDESKIVTEKLLTMIKKKDMEEAKEIVKSYYKM